MAFPKLPKHAQARLQTAADRALAEQVALVRCWRQSRDCLEQWSQHAAGVAPVLRGLGRRYRSAVQLCVEELSRKEAALVQLCSALKEAEDARIKAAPVGSDDNNNSIYSTTSSKIGAPLVSPLDSLARGTGGREVAALVAALRLHKEDMSGAAQSVLALGDKLNTELRRELEVLEGCERNALSAAAACSEMLQSTHPSSKRNDEAFEAAVNAVAPSSNSSTRRQRSMRQQFEDAAISPGGGGRGGAGAVSVVRGGGGGSGRIRNTGGATAATSSAKSSALPLAARPPFDVSS